MGSPTPKAHAIAQRIAAAARHINCVLIIGIAVTIAYTNTIATTTVAALGTIAAAVVYEHCKSRHLRRVQTPDTRPTPADRADLDTRLRELEQRQSTTAARIGQTAAADEALRNGAPMETNFLDAAINIYANDEIAVLQVTPGETVFVDILGEHRTRLLMDEDIPSMYTLGIRNMNADTALVLNDWTQHPVSVVLTMVGTDITSVAIHGPGNDTRSVVLSF